MPASLTEEELARLEVNVRTCQRSRMPMTVLPTEQAEKLLASARAARNESENSSRLSAIREAVRLEKAFLVECRGVREDQEVDEREDFVALLERYLNAPPGGYPHEQAITATAEPTDGEKR